MKKAILIAMSAGVILSTSAFSTTVMAAPTEREHKMHEQKMHEQKMHEHKMQAKKHEHKLRAKEHKTQAHKLRAKAVKEEHKLRAKNIMPKAGYGGADIGNAIMAGHVDNYIGPAVFYPLKNLIAGNEVIVSDTATNKLIFEVISVEAYLATDAPIDKIFGETGEIQLNLITCTGEYNRISKEYDKRLVVYTRLKESQ